jgi:serine/threonine-protein kinase HipA
MEDVIARTPKVIQQVRGMVPPGFPGQIADSILRGIKAATETLKAELSRS